MATSSSNTSTLTGNLGDSHFFDESIHPSTIRQYLTSADPTNSTLSNNTYYLQGMKWLLASMSKGRDVSDFFPHVVKLVSIHNLEIRKMVYIFLIHYADHNETCRELSLLSINGFQRGLADGEQLIRALALRVLSSIRVPDILQIQILAIKTCAKDSSPYVRKCAANAISKVYPTCVATDVHSQSLLINILQNLLEEDISTMVLSSSMTSFLETCFPNKLELLHRSFRKLCHLLTDMDEWGQVICIDILTRYCRLYFKQPWKEESSTTNTSKTKKKIKRRVVKKAFYSDDEEESYSEEEEYTYPISGAPVPKFDDKQAYDQLDSDHRLLLQSSLPLLKSRNSAVVLSVCTLHYYCGLQNSHDAIAKALVRICRDRREISYVVLTSIRSLVESRPEIFSPFLNDFFVKATDPSFSRILKIEILVRLALNEQAITTILTEIKSYVRHQDKPFVQKCLQALVSICEVSFRILSKDEAFVVCLNCLYGLTTLSYASKNEIVVGEAIISICNIFRLILAEKEKAAITDDNSIKSYALKRLLYLLLRSIIDDNDTDNEENNEDLILPPKSIAYCIYILGELFLSSSEIISEALDPTSSLENVQTNILECLAESFTESDIIVKLQCIHFASKIFVLNKTTTVGNSSKVLELCESLLSLARLDINQDIRDRARFESQLLHSSFEFQFDLDTLYVIAPLETSLNLNKKKIVQNMFKDSKPPFKTLWNEGVEEYRFGTLSSFVHHPTSSFHSLPDWASENSPTSLRDQPDTPQDPIENARKIIHKQSPSESRNTQMSQFYGEESSSESEEESSDDEEDDDSSLDGEKESTEEESSEEESDDDSSEEMVNQQNKNNVLNIFEPAAAPKLKSSSLLPSSFSEDEESSEEESSEEEAEEEVQTQSLLFKSDTPSASLPTTKGQAGLVEGLEGLIMTPLVQDATVSSSYLNQDEETFSSQWYTPLKQELCAGLFFQMRYLRGASKKKQLEIMGINESKSSNLSLIILLQVTFENKRVDNGMIRRIRILQRGGSSSSASTPRRIVLYPPELPSLSKQKKTSAYLLLDFLSQTSSRSYNSKLELKTDRGSYPLDIKIPFCELLSSIVMKKTDFVKNFNSFGESQRTKYIFERKDIDTSSLMKKVVKYANLTPVDNLIPKNAQEICYFTTSIPSTSEIIYVSIDVSKGEVLACSYDAIATTALIEAVKLSFLN